MVKQQKHEKTLTFYANKTVETLQLCKYSGDFDDKWTSLKRLIFLTLTLRYFFLGKFVLKGVIYL